MGVAVVMLVDAVEDLGLSLHEPLHYLAIFLEEFPLARDSVGAEVVATLLHESGLVSVLALGWASLVA